MSAMTNYLENKLIDHIFRGVPFPAPTTLYIALLVASPDDTNNVVEASGAGYSRVAVSCNTSNWAGTQGIGTTTTSNGVSGTTSNNNVVTFNAPTSNWGDIVGTAVMDSATGGNSLFQGMLSETVTVNAGGPAPSFPVSTFSLQIDN